MTREEKSGFKIIFMMKACIRSSFNEFSQDHRWLVLAHVSKDRSLFSRSITPISANQIFF